MNLLFFIRSWTFSKNWSILISESERKEKRKKKMELEQATAFVKEIIEKECFSLDFDDFEEMEEVFGEKGISVCRGVTKVVFFRDDLDFLVKFGWENENWGLEAEYRTFEAAETQGLSRYFAKTSKIQNTNGIWWIAQGKYEIDTNLYYAALEPYCEEEIYEWDRKSKWDKVWNMDCLSDSEVIQALFEDAAIGDFLRNREIGDFHSKNFGWKDGAAVLIDFCGI